MNLPILGIVTSLNLHFQNHTSSANQVHSNHVNFKHCYTVTVQLLEMISYYYPEGFEINIILKIIFSPNDFHMTSC